MPYKSEAQRRYFNSPAGKAKIGKEEVEHWNEVSKGKELPEKAVDKAIAICDKQFPTYSEALKYAQSNGLSYSDVKENHGSFSVETEVKREVNKPKLYKYTYSVRERYGNKVTYIDGPLSCISTSNNLMKVKKELNDKVKKRSSNFEVYNVNCDGEI